MKWEVKSAPFRVSTGRVFRRLPLPAALRGYRRVSVTLRPSFLPCGSEPAARRMDHGRDGVGEKMTIIDEGWSRAH